MPAVSKSQQRLFQAAEHNADFPAARKIRSSMTHQQMHDFAVGSEKGKPEHVPHGPAKRDSAAHQATQEQMRKAGYHIGQDHEKPMPHHDLHGRMRYL